MEGNDATGASTSGPARTGRVLKSKALLQQHKRFVESVKLEQASSELLRSISAGVGPSQPVWYDPQLTEVKATHKPIYFFDRPDNSRTIYVRPRRKTWS